MLSDEDKFHLRKVSTIQYKIELYFDKLSLRHDCQANLNPCGKMRKRIFVGFSNLETFF